MQSSPTPNKPDSPIRVRFEQITAEIAANPRLQLGLAAIALIAIVFGLLNLDDRRTAALRKLNTLQVDNRRISKQLGGVEHQLGLQTRLDAAHTLLEQDLWRVSSPVIAQAELTDWLSGELTDAGIKDAKISQPSVKSFAEKPTDTANSKQTDGKDCDSEDCKLIELRTSVRIPFDTALTSKVLARLESAERPLRIEQLSINTTERRVELTLLALAALSDKDTAAKPLAASEAAKPATIGQPAPSDTTPEAPKKLVEVKW